MREYFSPWGIRSLTPIQIVLSIGVGLLLLLTGALIVFVNFNIKAANTAFNSGYALNDLAQIERGILMLRIETEEFIQDPRKAGRPPDHPPVQADPRDRQGSGGVQAAGPLLLSDGPRDARL